jgi:hypothetical protein
MSLVDFGPYGVRRGQTGWRRSTSYHPYDFLEGTSEEKLHVTASGTGKRLLEASNGHKERPSHKPEGNGAAARSHGGQSRSPFDRVAG